MTRMQAAVMWAVVAVVVAAAGWATPIGAATPRAGSTFKDCVNCPEMVVVPEGSFLMGSPESDTSRDMDEGQHRVTFKRPFAVSKYPVTWDQWEACVRDGMCDGPGVEVALRTGRDGQPMKEFTDWGRGSRPVVGVSWYDAQVFAGWLNRKTGKDAYRLLSESEFEYSARAGSTTTYPWGDQPSHDHANYGKADGQGLGGEAAGRDKWLMETSPVGAFPPNAFGLYDMHGNIYQWIEDCYEPNVDLLPTDGSAMKNGNCGVRGMRSNSFESNPKTMRSANRAFPYPLHSRGRNYLGIRIAKTLE